VREYECESVLFTTHLHIQRRSHSSSITLPLQFHRYVVTRWYRCPEILLSPNKPYSEAIDLWSIGCILGELIKRKPLFPGKSHANQVQLIFEVLGYDSPRELGVPISAEAATFLERRCRARRQPLGSILPEASREALSLMDALLQVNPHMRPSAAAALQHVYCNDPDNDDLHDYKRGYLCRPSSEFFNFETEKQSTAMLKSQIVDEVRTLSASRYREENQRFAGPLDDTVRMAEERRNGGGDANGDHYDNGYVNGFDDGYSGYDDLDEDYAAHGHADVNQSRDDVADVEYDMAQEGPASQLARSCGSRKTSPAWRT
jgi:serine/threonine protein kinase